MGGMGSDLLISASLDMQQYTSATLDTATVLTDVEVDQISIKLSAYSAVWLYSLHELYSAVGKCDESASGDDDSYLSSGAPHAWDEGWAFWAGSEQTEGATDGSLSYTLAEKRCGDFTTCGSAGDESSGTALVNSNLLALYNTGLDELMSGDCDGANATKSVITSQMTIPLVQGTLKYLWNKDIKGGNSSGATSGRGKAASEAYAFAWSLFPMVYKCDTTVATDMITYVRALTVPALSSLSPVAFCSPRIKGRVGHDHER